MLIINTRLLLPRLFVRHFARLFVCLVIDRPSVRNYGSMHSFPQMKEHPFRFFFFFLFSFFFFFFTGNVWKVASKQFRTSQKNPNDNAASAPRSPCDSAVIKRFVNDKCQNSNTLKEFESWNESTSLKNIPARSETATTGADSFT